MTSTTDSESPLPGASNESTPAPQPVSCVTCRRRKVKCDKTSPCSNCSRLGLQCDYAPRKRAPRQPRKGFDGSSLSAREVELVKRLNKLEGIVKELSGQTDGEEIHNAKESGDPNDDGNGEDIVPKLVVGRASQHEDAVSLTSPQEVKPIEKDFGTLVISEEGKSRYVNHNFWSRVTEEVGDIVQLVYEDYDEEDDESSPEANDPTSAENDHQSFVLQYSSSNVDLRQLHPLPSQLPFYFQVYAQKVDPIIKLLHMPSLEKTMKEAANDLDSLRKDQEALLFAIYFAVVSSLSVDEVRMNFAAEKKVIRDRYCFGVEQALARARFLDSCDLMTLQAFVLYLTIVRCQGDSRVGWALSRSAIAVAQSLGLHRDGSHFGLPPFECEMRRRLWWQLCVLDFRNSERQGSEPSIAAGTYDTKLPLNINDSDLLPSATVAPEPRVGLTEITLTLIACELTSAVFTLQRARNNNAPLSSIVGSTIKGKDAIIQEFCCHLQDTYVRHCTDSSVMSWMIFHMCQLIIYKMEAILLLPLMQAVSKPEISKAAGDQIFVRSIKIVDLRRNLEVEKTKQWHWYIRTMVQWHAIAFLLSELCVREPDDNVTWAWNVLDTVFQDWKNFREQGAPGMLWLPMRKLIARARQKREHDLSAAREAEAAKLQMPTQQHFNLELPQSVNNTSQAGLPENTQNVSYLAPESYPGPWPQQQQQYPATTTPTPWLLEDSAMQELGLDLNALGENIQEDGFDYLMQDFHPSLVEAPDMMTTGSAGWDPLWWKEP